MPRSAPICGLVIVPRLREIRGERRLLAMEEVTGVKAPVLSQLERGERFPQPKDVAGLELGYGPRAGWYTLTIEARA